MYRPRSKSFAAPTSFTSSSTRSASALCSCRTDTMLPRSLRRVVIADKSPARSVRDVCVECIWLSSASRRAFARSA